MSGIITVGIFLSLCYFLAFASRTYSSGAKKVLRFGKLSLGSCVSVERIARATLIAVALYRVAHSSHDIPRKRRPSLHLELSLPPPFLHLCEQVASGLDLRRGGVLLELEKNDMHKDDAIEVVETLKGLSESYGYSEEDEEDTD